MYNELLLRPRCNVRIKRFKGALSLLGRLTYVSSWCSMVSAVLGSMHVNLTSTRTVRIYLLIKNNAYVELKKWVKIYQIKKRKQNILRERARCQNEQEMSDRKQLITNKLYDDEGWGSLFSPTKLFLFCRNFISLSSYVFNLHSPVVALYIHIFATV